MKFKPSILLALLSSVISCTQSKSTGPTVKNKKQWETKKKPVDVSIKTTKTNTLKSPEVKNLKPWQIEKEKGVKVIVTKKDSKNLKSYQKKNLKPWQKSN